jgi:hypothetical protein
MIKINGFYLLFISYSIEIFQVETNLKKYIIVEIFSLIHSHFPKEKKYFWGIKQKKSPRYERLAASPSHWRF